MSLRSKITKSTKHFSPALVRFIKARKLKQQKKKKQIDFDVYEDQSLFLTILPQEIILHIFSFLDARDLNSASLVNHHYYFLTQCSFTWKQLCQIDFGASILNAHTHDINWKCYYYAKQQIKQQPKASQILNCDHISHYSSAFTWDSAPWFKEKSEHSKRRLPSPRMSHAGCIIYDAKRYEKIVYIGGQLNSTTRYNEIHYLDTKSLSFKKVNVIGNVPTFARMGCVSINNKIYCFGGYDGHSTLFETAIFDPILKTWTQPQCYGNLPLPRTNFACTSVGKKMYIHGGNVNFNGQYSVLGDLFELDTETLTWTNLTPLFKGEVPHKRSSHRMVYLSNKLYLFGGGVWTPGAPSKWIQKFNDLHAYDLKTNTWTKVKTTGPINVCTFSMPFVVGPFLFIFGGQTIEQSGLCSNELFCFDSITSEWSQIECKGTLPRKRDIGCINLTEDNRVILFGGSSGVPINDLNILTLPNSFKQYK